MLASVDARRRPAAVRVRGPHNDGSPTANASAGMPAPSTTTTSARGDQCLRRQLSVLLVRAAKPGDPTHTMSLDEAWASCASAPRSRSPKCTWSTACIPICRSTTTWVAAWLQADPPRHPLESFTAVEIAFFADLYRRPTNVLRELMAAGLDSLPGGGAVFAERVRQRFCHDKWSDATWPFTRSPSPRMRSNVTMLYGHRDRRRARRSHAARAPAGRNRRFRRSSRSRSIPTTTRCRLPPPGDRHVARSCRRPPDARQYPHVKAF